MDLRQLALLCSLLLAGCAAPLLDVPPGQLLSQTAEIKWEGEAPRGRELGLRLRMLDQSWAAYSRWAGERGLVPRAPRVVRIYMAGRLPRDLTVLRAGQSLMGQAAPLLGEVRLPGRGRYPLRAACHEFHHLVVIDGDHDRDDWRAVDALGWSVARSCWGILGD